MPFVFDIEADGLLGDATKIHCLSYRNLNTGDRSTLTDYPSMLDFVRKADVLIGHNIVRYDLPVLSKIIGLDRPNAVIVDTLALSWYLEPDRLIHGLEEWGDELGVEKPRIEDWKNQSLDDYIHRCEEDVEINTLLWKRFKKRLTLLYGDWQEAKKLIAYLTFKMDCAAEQERSGWKLDVEYAQQSIQKLTEAKEAKQTILVAEMPQQPVVRLRTRPMKLYKKNGTYSESGAKWFALLAKNNLPLDYNEEIKEVVRYEQANPNSVAQVKDWLFDLGWRPATFKIVRDKKTGDIKKIPQINLEHGGGLCPSVRRIADNGHAGVLALDELGVINHRLSLLTGFLDNVDKQGSVKAQISGFTNTLRFIHKTIVNLPKANQKYGEEIRGVLIADDDKELCGSDMASLEDRLKQHYIYPHDPKYVEEMNIPGYDPHLSLALLAGEVTEEQVNDYKSGASKVIKPIRDIFKNGNYACQYGAMPPRLSLTANIPIAKAKQVHAAYWEKNWAIKVVAAEQRVKRIKGQMWLFNPVSKFWYSLRHEKDIFSTLVQGTAAYVFDKWVEKFRAKRPQLTAQFHDEVVLTIKRGHREQAKKLLFTAIDELNQELQLNRELGIDVQFGDRYSEIH